MGNEDGQDLQHLGKVLIKLSINDLIVYNLIIVIYIAYFDFIFQVFN